MAIMFPGPGISVKIKLADWIMDHSGHLTTLVEYEIDKPQPHGMRAWIYLCCRDCLDTHDRTVFKTAQVFIDSVKREL